MCWNFCALNKFILNRGMCVTNRAYRLSKLVSVIARSSSSTPSTTDYFTKNESLKRPLSPFTIYKPQITSVLSISHRMTGLALSVLLYGGGIAALGLQSTNFAQVLQTVQTSVPDSLLITFKVLAGTSLVYHTVNGLRHLAWDFGYGFGLKQLYASGYIVLGITLLAAIGIILSNN